MFSTSPIRDLCSRNTPTADRQHSSRGNFHFSDWLSTVIHHQEIPSYKKLLPTASQSDGSVGGLYNRQSLYANSVITCIQLSMKPYDALNIVE